jgi:nucleoside 2-deoxyribosyltransferase
MKIYFSAAIRNGALDPKQLALIIAFLKTKGEVLTEVLFNPKDFGARNKMTDRQIFERDLKWVRESDCVIAEVSAPSTGVGIEIQYADMLGLPILCLFNPNYGTKLSGMVSGHPRLSVSEYQNISDAKNAVAKFLKESNSKTSKRAPLKI